MAAKETKIFIADPTNRAPNVLVLLTGLFDTPGGIQTLNRSTVKAFADLSIQNGWKTTVLALNDSDDHRAKGIYYTPGGLEYRAFKRDKIRFTLSAIRRSLKSDLVYFGHVRFLPIAAVTGLLRPRSKKLTILYGAEAWGPLSIWKKMGLRRIAKVLTISHYTREQFLRANPAKNLQFDLFPPSLDPAFADHSELKSRAQLALPQGKMLLSVSRLDSSEGPKRIDRLIRSLPALLKRFPDLFYVVLGGVFDGSDLERLKTVAANAGVSNKVFFTGEVSDALRYSYYNTSDIFVLPSVKEGFGIVFLEAMHHGKPCVGANQGGIPEVIENGRTGFLVNPERSEDLVESLATLLQDEPRRREMGRAGRKRLEEEFSYPKFRNRLDKIVSPWV